MCVIHVCNAEALHTYVMRPQIVRARFSERSHKIDSCKHATHTTHYITTLYTSRRFSMQKSCDSLSGRPRKSSVASGCIAGHALPHGLDAS